MSEFIFIMRKAFSNKQQDYKFMDKTELEQTLKSPTHIINEYQYGFINPDNDTICVHQLNTETLKVMFECD